MSSTTVGTTENVGVNEGVDDTVPVTAGKNEGVLDIVPIVVIAAVGMNDEMNKLDGDIAGVIVGVKDGLNEGVNALVILDVGVVIAVVVLTGAFVISMNG